MTHFLDSEMNRCRQELRMLQAEAIDRKPLGDDGMFSIAGSIFNKFIRNAGDIRDVIVTVVSKGAFLTDMGAENRAKLHDLVEQSIEKARTEIPFINTRPADANGFKSYGLRMIVIKHYMLVRGIRSRVREDMDSFVEFYEHTILPTGAAGSSNEDKRAKFYEYYGLLRSHDGDKTHTQDTAMYLEQLGADIARRMLIMGTHLVELVCALHALDGIKQASMPSTDESGH